MNIEFLDLDQKPETDDLHWVPALTRIRKDVGTGLSFEAVMEGLWQACKSLIPYDRIGVAFIDNDGQRVTARYFRVDYDPGRVRLGENYSAGLGSSSLKEILKRGMARIIHDLEAYLKAHERSDSTRLLLEEGVRSSITLPLRVGKRAVGFLFFSSRQKRAFAKIHLHQLRLLEQSISQAIEKVWMIRHLEEGRQDFLRVLAFVAHEMKSPLAALATVGNTYAKGYMGKADPLAVKTIDKMTRISGYMINMVNNYLDLSRLESGEMAFNPSPGLRFKEEVLSFALDTVAARAEERKMEVVVEKSQGDYVLNGDRDLLRVAAVNLLDNAVKYGEEKGEVRVKLSRRGDHMRFSVWNAGVGFADEQKERLFKRFSRLNQKGLEDRRGSGLGLYLVWWVIDKHGGEVTADSQPGQWAEFTISLKLDS